MKMRKYKFNSNLEFKIEHNSENVNMTEINEILEHDAHHIKNRVTFPSGLITETTQTATHGELLTNWVLVKLKDGSIVLAEPIPENEQ